MIQSPIENGCIKVELDDVNGGKKTELYQKVILQVSILKIHIEILKKGSTGFSMAYDKMDFTY